MSSLTVATETAILQLIFNNTPWPYNGNLYVSLHNADPTESGNQTSFETAYNSYSRVPVAPSAWAVSGADPVQASNVSAIVFPYATNGNDLLTFWGLGTALTGTGILLLSGAIGLGTAYTFSAIAASPGLLTVPGSSLAVNQAVVLYANGPSANLPAGVSEGTLYFVGTVSAFGATLSTTVNNANPVVLTGSGSGLFVPVNPLPIAPGVGPMFKAATLTTYLN